MSETKFTPGPWEALDFGGNCLVVTEMNQHGRESIALFGTHGEKSKANARLSAAAPDMYEALKHALSDMDTIDEICRIAGVHKFTMMRSEIEAALTKAQEES